MTNNQVADDQTSTASLAEVNAKSDITEPQLTKIRILCVDDNVDAADSLGTMLDLVGYDTTVTHDAPTALERALTFAPQVCILDITMPGMDGCQLARRLRDGPRGEEMLLIALTALGDFASLERMVDSGFDLYYPKPIAPSLLYSVLNDFAEKGRPG